MHVSLEWLREYATLDAPVATLVRALVDTGTEVDRVHRGPEGVVVARVTALEPVPELTRGVRFADIDLGEQTLRVLTGAPNVNVGDLVPYAPPGTLLPGWDAPLGVRRMFNRYDSPGMLCSDVELGTGQDADGLLVLERGHPGQPIHEVVAIDVVLEVDVTTNRPDCLCHVGIARELAAALGEDLRPPECAVPASSMSAVTLEGRASVRIDDSAGCPRFMLRLIEGVSIGPSPGWLQRRLRSIGLRPINNVVDITNFVAHELGQPLHAFDADRVAALSGAGADLVVRRAGAGERLTCLDGVERELNPEDMVVAAGDVAVSLAGVMGGSSTAVSDQTTRVLLESASWNGPQIRATSRRHSLRSDASALFEKGLPDLIPPRALERAAALIADLGSAHVLTGVIDEWPAPLEPIAPVEITGARLSQLLGTPVEVAEAATVLARLGFVTEEHGDLLTATPPDFRRDVAIPEDVVEEVGRSLGYERLPSTLPGRRLPVARLAPEIPADENARDILVGAGFDEAITWSFISDQLAARLSGLGEERTPMELRNPLSEEWRVLRTSCLPGLVQALAGNLNHGVEDVHLFEIGRVFWEGERHGLAAGSTADNIDSGLVPLPAEPLVLALAMHARDAGGGASALRHAHATLDGIAHQLSGRRLTATPQAVPGLRPGRSGALHMGSRALGVLGELDAEVLEQFDLRGRVVVAEIRLDALVPEHVHVTRYRPAPRFPAVVQDLAVAVEARVAAASGLAAIHEAGGGLLESAVLFDEFHGGTLPEGRKGWTFRLTFRAPDRTLRAEDAQSAQEAIVLALRSRCGAELRS